MALKVGDKVRIDTGTEGKVVLIYADRVAALVKLRNADPDATLVSLPVKRLTPIKAYTSAPDPPPAS